MKYVMTDLIDKDLLSAMNKAEQKCIFWSSGFCEGETEPYAFTGSSGINYQVSMCKKHDHDSSYELLKSLL